MGFHATAGTATTAPAFFYNSSGQPSWCGKRTNEMDAVEMEAMLTFCSDEGWRLGYNDQQSGRPIDQGVLGLFHSDFADGTPHRLWRESYLEPFSLQPIDATHCES